MTAADCPSGWLRLKKLMWLVSTRSRKMPSDSRAPIAMLAVSTRPGCRVDHRATRRSGGSRYRSCGGWPVSGFTRLSSVGISTREMTKSTMMPTAEPMPNDRTATTLLVASDSIPSAVVALAPSSGVARCATVLVNACSTPPWRRSSSQCCMMCTSSAIARTTIRGTIMLARTL